MNIIDTHQTNNQLAPNHWHEWVVNSAVDPKLTALNVRSLTDYRGFKSPSSITGKFWVGV